MNTEDKVEKFLQHNTNTMITKDEMILLMAFNNFVLERCAHPYIIEDFCKICAISTQSYMVQVFTAYLNFMNSDEGRYKHWNKINTFLQEKPVWWSIIKEPEIILEEFEEFTNTMQQDRADRIFLFREHIRQTKGYNLDLQDSEMLHEYWSINHTTQSVTVFTESYKVWSCPTCHTKQFLEHQQNAPTVKCKICKYIFNTQS